MKAKRAAVIGAQILGGVALYCLFSFALFLGLQVSTLAGTLSVLGVFVLCALYAYWLVRFYGRKKRP